MVWAFNASRLVVWWGGIIMLLGLAAIGCKDNNPTNVPNEPGCDGAGPNIMTGISFGVDNQLLVSGSNHGCPMNLGLILKYDGQNWSRMEISEGLLIQDISTQLGISEQDIRNSGNLRIGIMDVVGATVDEAWACGEKGLIYKLEGEVWTPLGNKYRNSDWADTWESLWISPAGQVYGVGTQGRIFVITEDNVNIVQLETEAHLDGIWGWSDNQIFVTSRDGLLFTFDGVSWEQVDNDFGGSGLFCVQGMPDGRLFVGGQGGLVFQYDGQSWTQDQIPQYDVVMDILWDGSNVVALVSGQDEISDCCAVYKLEESWIQFQSSPDLFGYSFVFNNETACFLVAGAAGWDGAFESSCVGGASRLLTFVEGDLIY